MTIAGETLASGAPRTCPNCFIGVVEIVMHSNAGYYIGTSCDCGPYSRESEYYKTRKGAEKVLYGNDYERRYEGV